MESSLPGANPVSESSYRIEGAWVGKVFVGTLVVAILIGWDFKFLPYWFNLAPIVGLFLGLFLNALICTYIKPRPLFQALRLMVFFAGTLISVCMLIDRFGDFTDPEVVPAQVTRLYQGNFLALSSWGVEATYPDGTTVGVGGGHFQFDFTPTHGMKGKAIIGRGLFGIRYIQRLEFDPNAPQTK